MAKTDRDALRHTVRNTDFSDSANPLPKRHVWRMAYGKGGSDFYRAERVRARRHDARILAAIRTGRTDADAATFGVGRNYWD